MKSLFDHRRCAAIPPPAVTARTDEVVPADLNPPPVARVVVSRYEEKPKYLLNGVCVASSGVAYSSSSIEQLDDERVDHMVIHQYGAEGRQRVFSVMHACAGMVPLDRGGALCCDRVRLYRLAARHGEAERARRTEPLGAR
jgi:hypothetical protein